MRSINETVIDHIRRRGFMKCAVSTGIIGLSFEDNTTGQWRGFDVDVARAISEALLVSRRSDYDSLSEGVG
jgi:ABC-type amino acid transport substrate-binding protein